MGRMTRAALRAHEPTTATVVYEDADASDSSTQENTGRTAESARSTNSRPATNLSTSTSNRPIFGELTGNNIPILEPEALHAVAAEAAMPAKKGKGGARGKKAGSVRGGAAANKRKNQIPLAVEIANNGAPYVEVVEDDHHSDASEAAEQAADDLRKDDPVPETFQVPIDMTRPKSPESRAVREARRSLNASPERDVNVTSKFDPGLRDAVDALSRRRQEWPEGDSFMEEIITRTPRPASQGEEQKEDSFVENIIARSPNKGTPRIEDSVAELDALDEAIEKVAGTLPVVPERDLESPPATRDSAAKPVPQPAKSQRAAQKRIVSTLQKTNSRASTVRVKPTAVRPSVLPPNQRCTSAAASSRPGLSFSSSPEKASAQSNTAHQRKPSSAALSTSKPGFVPAKSSKPLTKSTFTLPGEVYAAKMKAQREERLKREEESAAAKDGKATLSKRGSVRISSIQPPSVKPRETKTSQARQSLMMGRAKEEAGTVSPAEKERSPVKDPRMPGDGVGKKTASASIRANSTAVRRSVSAMAGLEVGGAKTKKTATTTTAASRRRSLTPASGSTTAAAVAATVNRSDLQNQRVRAREIFGRERADKEAREAARRARAEAAERGRIASREWAERQRKRLQAEASAVKGSQQVAAAGAGAAV